jgi:uncharacterized protein (TIGR03435 family)
MKKMTLWAFALAALPLSPLSAQGLTGTWQGTLQDGKDLRIVFKISMSEKDALKGIMYNVDQDPLPLPASVVTLRGLIVKISFPGIGGTYDGKLDADGKSIAGTWTQGPKPVPLILTRATNETAWATPEPPPPPKKMRADADPKFEVATIKPSKPGTPARGFIRQGRRMVVQNAPLTFFITYAYGLHAKQIANVPAWLDSERYDITAEPDGEGEPSQEQWKRMFQKLLADRFQLASHKETKELSAYAITVGKDGPKLTKSEGDPNGLPTFRMGRLGSFVVRNATVAYFAEAMEKGVLDRPVVDRTGFSGTFDFTLDWTPEPSQFGGRGGRVLGQTPPATDDPAAPPDLFTAMVQ